MNSIDLISQNENNYCWKCIPIQYDNYEAEVDDKYSGDIFGMLSQFVSPHFLWKRFHKNVSKAMVISRLQAYTLKSEEEEYFNVEIEEHATVSFSIEILCRHQSLVLLVSAFETFIKDTFVELLKLSPSKLNGKTWKRMARKYNFQNVESINAAFSWLLDKDVQIIDNKIRNALNKRHKIIHESYYDSLFTEDELQGYFNNLFLQADIFYMFLDEDGYWEIIKPKN